MARTWFITGTPPLAIATAHDESRLAEWRAWQLVPVAAQGPAGA